jgi:hypothetical protein
MSRVTRAFALVTLCVITHATSNALAAGDPTYAYSRVVDSSAGFNYIMPTPSINDDGTVVFFGKTGGGSVLGLYQVKAGALTTLATNAGPVNVFESYHSTFFGTAAFGIHSDPVVTNTGQVYFAAALDAGPRGYYTFDGSGSLTTVVDDTGPILSATTGGTYGAGPRANDAGRVSFHAQLDAGGDAIMNAANGTVTTLYSTTSAGSAFSAFQSDTGISHDGTTSFVGTSRATGRQGVYRGTGGTPTLIADAAGAFSAFDALANLPVNDVGRVAFKGTLTNGATALAYGDGGLLTIIADTTGPYSGFMDLHMNAGGKAVFVATLDAGGRGLYTGPNPATDKVVAVGDALDGSTITDTYTLGNPINDLGQIVFWASLADGRSGIYTANPVPEPAGWAVAALAVASLPLTGRHRRSSTSGCSSLPGRARCS